MLHVTAEIRLRTWPLPVAAREGEHPIGEKETDGQTHRETDTQIDRERERYSDAEPEHVVCITKAAAAGILVLRLSGHIRLPDMSVCMSVSLSVRLSVSLSVFLVQVAGIF